MKMLIVLILSLLSYSSFCSDFTCSARVIDNNEEFSVVSIDGFWRSSASYEDQSLDLPKGADKVKLDFDIDGRIPNEPKVTFLIKKGNDKKVSKKIILEKLGATKTYKLGKKRHLEFSCG